jgi:2'-5' RNA ligase
VPTIGVAVAIPEPWGQQLQDYRLSLGDEMATTIPTHITLVPPMEIGIDELPAIEAHLADVASRTDAFDIHLRGTGTFRPVSPVVFVSLVEGISQTEQLAAAVRMGPLDTDLHFPFHPHVTIAHHLDERSLDLAFNDLATFECVFTADEFHLYLHDDDTGWAPNVDFKLRPGAVS